MENLSPFYNTFYTAITNCWPMLTLFIAIIVILRVTKNINSREKIIFYQEFYQLLAIIYFLILYYLLLSTEDARSGFNIIPFTEMTRYTLGSKAFMYNVIGNIVLFIPFGYIVSTYFNAKKTSQVFIVSFIVSLTAELIQYKIGRAFDVDDVILNVVGGTIGFLLFICINAIKNHLPHFLKNTIFYNCIAILILLGILSLFGSIWGIRF